MNLTTAFWNTTEESIGHVFLGGLTLIVYGYAIFVCYAIYDYQGINPYLVSKKRIDLIYYIESANK